MRVRGIPVDGVYIFDVWRHPQPVFHRWSGATSGRKAETTECGRSIFPPGVLLFTASLPARLAVKIARPCERCFPEMMELLP